MHVLIVEDDLQQASAFRAILKGLGAVCEVVRSVKDAIKMIYRRAFDLVVLDLFLPDGNTVSLSDHIRMRHPQTAIVSVTGTSVFPKGEHASVLSTDYILRKPVNPEEFTAIAEYLCRLVPPTSGPDTTSPV